MRFADLARLSARLLTALGVVLFLAACSKGAAPKPVAPADATLSGAFVLALSWEPAFCETASHVPECKAQTAHSIDARQFSLHGLWPTDSYCGVDAKTREADQRHHWEDLPEVTLSKATRTALDKAMPGTRSLLERHEWIKHGTCAGVDQETYFAAALALTDAVNASSLPDLFETNLGNSLSATRIARALDTDFGRGAGKHATLECVADGSRRLISGVRITIDGKIGNNPDLAGLIAAAASRSGGCKSGVIDPAGSQ